MQEDLRIIPWECKCQLAGLYSLKRLLHIGAAYLIVTLGQPLGKAEQILVIKVLTFANCDW